MSDGVSEQLGREVVGDVRWLGATPCGAQLVHFADLTRPIVLLTARIQGLRQVDDGTAIFSAQVEHLQHHRIHEVGENVALQDTGAITQDVLAN